MNTLPVRDLDAPTWKEGPYRTWVSKTDVVQYRRCPLLVHLAYATGASYGAFASPDKLELLDRGNLFEAQTVAKLQVEPVPDLAAARERDGHVRCTHLLRNHKLGYQGVLDLIAVERGAYAPIEIKNRRDVIPSDALELAFYWRLLSPLRRLRHARPHGYVVMGAGERRIDLLPEHFSELDTIVVNVRRVREEGARPVLVPECRTCRLQDEHRQRMTEERSVSLLSGVGRTFARSLEELGVHTISDMANASVAELSSRWSAYGRWPGFTELEAIHAHARAWTTGRPQILRSARWPAADEALIIDLEYEPAECVFAAGVLTVEHGEPVHVWQGLAERPTDEPRLLHELGRVLERRPSAPILTWSGGSADLPQLASAVRRAHSDGDQVARVQARHLDLYQLARASLRLPLHTFSLGTVAGYFGFKPVYEGLGGWQMPVLYRRYMSATSPSERQAMREQLLGHNLDDLRATLHAWRSIGETLRGQVSLDRT